MPRIVIRDVIQSPIAVSSEDAEKLYTVLRQNLDAQNEIELSFEGIDDFISSFLNASVGKLYNGDFNNDFIDSHIEASGLDKDDKEVYNSVITRAKAYYKNPRHFDAVEEELDNES
jgi:hypothetical protein